MTVAQFRAYFAESDAGVFDSMTDTLIQRALDLAAAQVSALHGLALLNVAAHELAVDHFDLAGVDDGAGIVSEERMGELQKVYQTQGGGPKMRDDWLRSKFGRRALRLLRSAGGFGSGRWWF